MTCFLVSSARPLPPAPPTPSCTPPNAPNVHPVSNVPPTPPKETVGGRTTAFIPEKQRFGELEPARKKRSASKKPPDEGGRAPTDDGGGGGDRRSLNAQLSAEGGLSAEGRLSAEGGLSTEGGLYGWEPSSGLSQREWLRRVPRLERCCTQARFTHHSSLSPSVTERLFPMYHRHVSPPPPPQFCSSHSSSPMAVPMGGVAPQEKGRSFTWEGWWPSEVSRLRLLHLRRGLWCGRLG